ncbi:MAG: thiamine pyrophosphate-dependent enzyme, partial [Deinococcales bacterium]
HEINKLTRIGFSTNSPTYILGQTHGYKGLHGRMPSLATGALMANHSLRGLGVSGDGDTGSIGMGQFKHMVRRNVRLVYVVENNGVYGLTKGQFSATADYGQDLKYAGHNDLPAIDICMEALVAGAGFVARSFAGDAKQVRELLKAALSHRGTAVLDIISPCVAFNDEDDSPKSYSYGRKHEHALQDIGFFPADEEIIIDPQEPGQTTTVELHDGSKIRLHSLEDNYDPTDKAAAVQRLQQAEDNHEFITGLIYYDQSRPNLAEISGLDATPLAALPDEALRPTPAMLEELMHDYN